MSDILDKLKERESIDDGDASYYVVDANIADEAIAAIERLRAEVIAQDLIDPKTRRLTFLDAAKMADGVAERARSDTAAQALISFAVRLRRAAEEVKK